jgi:hypothetical protein
MRNVNQVSGLEQSEQWYATIRRNILSQNSQLYLQEGKVVCAQDGETREVFIKLVKRHSDEFRIYELLKNTPSAYDEENFCCVLPPVDFLGYGNDYVFVVVPR